MKHLQEFIDVFLAEAKYAGYGIEKLDITNDGKGVYGIIATFKDGATALVRQRSDLFDGDNVTGRFELMQLLQKSKGPVPIIKNRPRSEDLLPKAEDTEKNVPPPRPLIELPEALKSYRSQISFLKAHDIKPASRSAEDVEAAVKSAFGL